MKDPGSFRDPSGYVFYDKDEIYRVIHSSYGSHYDYFKSSGLYNSLLNFDYVVKHEELDNKTFDVEDCHSLLKVEKIFPILYPYEWGFNQLKSAALFTLEIQKKAIEFNMSLKDATPYNIQFKNNKPIFIDTLSFEKLSDDYNWIAYKQFCENFLYPLLLMSKIDLRLNKLLITFIDGIPLDLAYNLLDFKSKLNPLVLLNIVIPKILKSKSKDSSKDGSKRKISKSQHLNLIKHLQHSIEQLNITKSKTEWDNYNEETENEKSDYVVDKINHVNLYTQNESYNIIWDIGANDGFYSRYFKNKANQIISLDIDIKCVDRNYLINKKEGNNNLTSVLFDISNPSPGIGWLNEERSSIFSRIGDPDIILFFAVMHHIINSNIPVEKIIDFLYLKTKKVIFEFIPFSDPKCKEIFKSRPDEFNYPSLDDFLKLLESKFLVQESIELKGTKRVLMILTKI